MWPDEYRTWAAGRGLLEPDLGTAAAADSSLRAARRDAAAASMRALEVVSPPDGATYLIDPTLRSEFQTLPLRARGTTGQLEWTINGRRLRQAPGQPVSWSLERGTHVFRARDARGRVAEASILVK